MIKYFIDYMYSDVMFYFKISLHQDRKKILALYDNFYNKHYSINSLEVSSHWEKYLKYTVVEYVNNNFLINQGGLSDLTQLNLRNVLKNILYICRNIIYLICNFSNVKVLFRAMQISYWTRRMINFDISKHVVLFSKLVRILNLKNYQNVVIIGDGLGFCGSLIKLLYPQVKVTFINLSKNLFLDFLFYNKISLDVPELLEPNQLNNFISKDSLFINIASFSEMNFNQIKKYVEFIKTLNGTLVSLNRNKKNLPNDTLIDLLSLLDSYNNHLVYYDKSISFYQFSPTNKLYPSKIKFDGDFHLIVLEFATK